MLRAGSFLVEVVGDTGQDAACEACKVGKQGAGGAIIADHDDPGERQHKADPGLERDPLTKEHNRDECDKEGKAVVEEARPGRTPQMDGDKVERHRKGPEDRPAKPWLPSCDAKRGSGYGELPKTEEESHGKAAQRGEPPIKADERQGQEYSGRRKEGV